MGAKTNTFPIEVKGGLITSVAPIQLGLSSPGSATRLINFEPSIQGGYRRINGYVKWDNNTVPAASPTSQILGVVFFDGTVVAVREDKIVKSDGAGWTNIATGRTHSGKHRYATYNFSGTRKIIGVDGSNYPYSWDKTTLVNINTSPDILGASCVVPFKDHMFYSKGNLLVFSAPFAETDFNTGNGAGSIRLPKAITGLAVFRHQLFIFTESTIHSLSGSSSSDFAMTSVNETIGCIATDTIQEVSGDVAFLASDGIRLLGSTDRMGDFSNQTASKAVQKPIADFTKEYSDFSSCVVREKSQYRIFGWEATKERDHTYGYLGTQFEPQNPESFSWGETKGIKVYTIDSKVHNTEEFIIFASDTPYVYRMEVGNRFDDQDISSTFWTPFISFTDPTYRKVVYKLFTYVSPEGVLSGNVSLRFNLDSSNLPNPASISFMAGAQGAVYGVDVYGTGSYKTMVRRTLKSPLVGSGDNVSLRFEFDGGAPFIMDTLMIEFMQKDRR